MPTLSVPGDYPTIAQAVAHAHPGDVIQVSAGYAGNETATITVENLTVTAPASLSGLNLVLGSGIVGITLGGSSNISVHGNSLANTIVGNAGNNNLDGGGGQDHYFGRGGKDIFAGGGGTDKDIADYSKDAAAGATHGIIANLSANQVQGGVASDTVIDGFLAHDSIVGIRNIVGTNFADKFYGGSHANVLSGLGGNDAIYGRQGADVLSGGTGNDLLIGGAGPDKLDGGADSDTASYADSQAGVTANLSSPASNTGDAQGDTYAAIENLAGSSFADFLYGNAGANVISGGNGNDRVSGLTGSDTLRGQLGNDTLTGGADNDRFDFTTALNGSTNVDTITDMNESGNDTVRLDDAVFRSVGPLGGLASGAFRANTTGLAQDSSDRIIHETDTGELYYDSNGNAEGGTYVLFAKVDPHITLTAADFWVI